MDKIEFNNLKILQQIEYINSQTKKGNSLEYSCKEIGIGKGTLRDRFSKLGYFYSKRIRKYLKNTELPHTVDKPKIQSNTSVSEVVATSEIQGNTGVSKKTKSLNKIMALSDRFDDIQNMLSWFELHKNDLTTIAESDTVTLDTDKFTGGTKITTVRLYKNIQENFKIFCRLYPQFKAMDIMDQALLEYMEKYN